MLSSVPVELQTHVFSYLPRKDLAAVARVSQHLHAVAIEILYLKVELQSWNHLESFFLPGSLIPSGSISATEHAEARRKHWESIKELTIRIDPSDKRFTKFLLPRSLRGRNVAPLQIDRLRLIYGRYDGTLHLLVPLLGCLNPKNVSLFSGRFWLTQEMLIALSEVGEWTRLNEITFGLLAGHAPERLVKSGRTSFFAGVVSGTVALEFDDWGNTQNGDDVVASMIALLPSLRHLRVVVEQSRKEALDALLGNGFGGKASEFFTVKVGDPKTFGRE